MAERTDRPFLEPGPDHPISIAVDEIAVRVRAGREVIAEIAPALELREHVYPPVLYVDRAAIEPGRLENSDHTSWCPYKGEARYFHVVLDDGTRLDNAVWSYESPFEAVEQIRGRLGFYTDRVSVEAL